MRSATKLAAIVLASVFAATGCTMLQGEQSPSEYTDDAALTARVKAALLDSDQVPGTRINVDAYQGEVTLSGFVESDDQRQRAEQIARQVPGVRNVQSNLRLAGAETEQSSRQAEGSSSSGQQSQSGQSDSEQQNQTQDQTQRQ